MLKRYTIKFIVKEGKGEVYNMRCRGEKCFYDRNSNSWKITDLGNINKVIIPHDVVMYIVESPPLPEERKE